MADGEVVKAPISRRYAGLIPAKPGEIRNPTGYNGLSAFSKELRAAGCLEDVKRVLKKGMSDESEPQIQLHAAALALKYILGVPEGEIVDGKKAKGFDWSSLTDEQREFLFAVRDALAARAASGNSATPGTGGGIHAGGSGGATTQGEPR